MGTRTLDVVSVPVVHEFSSLPSRPLVSVSILAFNHGVYVEKCLTSVLEQVCSFEIEILVGEDESSDDTRSICQRIASEHPDPIKLFIHSRDNLITINGRPTGRFNFLYNLSHCRGNYIS